MRLVSRYEERLKLGLARTPEGPTLPFRVHQFSLSRHIKSLQKRPVSYTVSLSESPPVIVTNTFGLMRIAFQNLFPAINISTVKLSACRRVVLFNFTEEDVDEEDKS
jgi:ribosome biogenesis protein SSF1/2